MTERQDEHFARWQQRQKEMSDFNSLAKKLEGFSQSLNKQVLFDEEVQKLDNKTLGDLIWYYQGLISNVRTLLDGDLMQSGCELCGEYR